jgi:glutamate 5-kinase
VGPDDFDTEWGELQMSVAVVDSLDEAIAHITKHGSKHTEVVVSEDRAVQERFVTAVDAAGVYVNASSRFADGFRYGFGAEVGVSTARLHARGPVGLEGLLSYKYRVYGHGHVTAGEDGVVFDHKDIPGVATVDDIGTDEALLRQPVADARRILLKVGSGVVTQLSTKEGDAPDGGIATGRVAHVAEQVAQLVKSGREVCLVSSGAVAAGRRVLAHALNDATRAQTRRELPIPGDPIPLVAPTDPSSVLPELSKAEQTRHAAAVGQGQIMGLYESLFKTYDTHVAQILISVPGLQFADSRAATCETIAGIMKRGIVPIVNENDVIASGATQGDGSIDPEELTITDNDAIAACLAAELKVDLVMLLSDIDGVRASAEASTHFRSLTEEQLQRGDVSFGAKSSMGRGGMESKVKAARYLARRDIPCVIANGTTNRYERKILDVARGKEVGTLFVPQKAA